MAQHEGGRGRTWVLGIFQSQGVLLIWIVVGQGHTVLAVSAGGVDWTFFSLLSYPTRSLSFSVRRLDID